jgi:ubiquinone biosynthesis protein
MELIHGVKGTETDKLHGDRTRLARLGGEVVLEMVFVDGFVHADMHPGNVFYTERGIVLIDLGMVAEIPAELQRPWAETFLAMAMQNATELARLFYGHAPVVFTADYAAYERDVETHFAKLYGKKLGEVEVSEAVGGIMNILRKHHVQVEPVFTVVHVALLVAEGLGKQLDPTLDVVQQAVPYLQRALIESPPGRPMRRVPPRSA